LLVKSSDEEYRFLPCTTEEFLTCMISMEQLMEAPYNLKLNDKIEFKAKAINNGLTVTTKDDSKTVSAPPSGIPFDLKA
jgi:hypothetical protein